MALVAMTEADFRESVVAACDGASWPAVSTAQVDLLVRRFKRADADGNSIDSDDYVESYEFDLAVAEAFKFRAGNCAALPDSRENEQSISASQIRAGLMAQAKEWSAGSGKGRLGTVALAATPLSGCDSTSLGEPV